MRSIGLASAIGLLLAACASTTPGAQPHEMSVAGHEGAAKEHEQLAEVHAAQYDTAARAAIERCANPRAGSVESACWSTWGNPTVQHLRDAESHRKMAAEHRAASKALRDAEASACVGVPEVDRDISPFEHTEDIADVEPLEVRTGSGKVQYRRMGGAEITFRAVPGMTAQWLQRVIDCHLARNAALGHVVPEMPNCPLVLKGVSANATPTRTGFAVDVESDDDAVAQEILRRARALTGR